MTNSSTLVIWPGGVARAAHLSHYLRCQTASEPLDAEHRTMVAGAGTAASSWDLGNSAIPGAFRAEAHWDVRPEGRYPET